jgi:N-acetyl-gamma-glutamyl-phosphate reductase
LLDRETPIEKIQTIFEYAYADEPFVDVMPAGAHPDTGSVRASNMCRIAIHRAVGSGKIVVLSVIDNLTKGAAGQAVQNMNIIFGIAEHTALTNPALTP